MLKHDWEYDDLSVDYRRLYDAGYDAYKAGDDGSGWPEPSEDLTRDSELTEQAEIWGAGYQEADEWRAELYNMGFQSRTIGIRLHITPDIEILDATEKMPWDLKHWLEGYRVAS